MASLTQDRKYEPEGAYEYQGILLTKSVPIQQVEEIKKFEFFEDDLIVATYPKAGISILYTTLKFSLDMNFVFCMSLRFVIGGISNILK